MNENLNLDKLKTYDVNRHVNAFYIKSCTIEYITATWNWKCARMCINWR